MGDTDSGTIASFVHASREDWIDLVLPSNERMEEFEQQLGRFKQQLFGLKPERQIPEPDSGQLRLGESLAPEKDAPVVTTTVHSPTRRMCSDCEASDDAGLLFDDSVPVKTIEIPYPELDGLPEHARCEVSEKITYRLGQEPGVYVVLRIVRRVVKRADSDALACPPAPPAMLERSYAEVSLLAGMLVDKFRYHLPPYRQDERLEAAAITVSRASLTS